MTDPTRSPAVSSPGKPASREPKDFSHLSEEDLYLFNEGTHTRLWERLGSHVRTVGGVEGTTFAVWAPNAEAVFVTGDFNGWSKTSHPLAPREKSGIWEGFIPGIGKATVYKYHVVSRVAMYRADKADPFALYAEVPPGRRRWSGTSTTPGATPPGWRAGPA